MQQMNIAIVNPVFIATFLGAPALAGASIAVAGSHARPWAIAATVLAVGTLVITFAGNIPLNDALDAAGPVDKIKDLGGRPRRLRVALGEAQHRAHLHLGRRAGGPRDGGTQGTRLTLLD